MPSTMNRNHRNVSHRRSLPISTAFVMVACMYLVQATAFTPEMLSLNFPRNQVRHRHFVVQRAASDEKTVPRNTGRRRSRDFGGDNGPDSAQKLGSSGPSLPLDEEPAVILPPSASRRHMSEVEMAAMSALGLGVSFSAIYILALNSDDAFQLTRVLQDGTKMGDALEGVAENIYTATVPRSAADVFSVALGEGIAGVIGAGATIMVSLLLRLRERVMQVKQQVGGVIEETRSGILSEAESRRDLFTEAVADGDYFLTRAAALPLFEAIGLPPLLATGASVVLASVPYELVKFNSQRNAAIIAEKVLMEQLLQEEKERAQLKQGMFTQFQKGRQESVSASVVAAVDPEALVSVSQGPQIDFPEIFADITKWLEYDVLKSDFSGKLTVNGIGLSGNLESAVFGFLAALSSQLYADLIYRYTEYGTDAKREESRKRSLNGWGELYTRKCLNAAALFGIYETVKGPVSHFLLTLLSGGVDSCLGSADYNLCVDTYSLSNPPEASSAAQFRSLATALVSLSSRLQHDDSIDKAEFFRSVLVQLYSFGAQVFSLGFYTP